MDVSRRQTHDSRPHSAKWDLESIKVKGKNDLPLLSNISVYKLVFTLTRGFARFEQFLGDARQYKT